MGSLYAQTGNKARVTFQGTVDLYSFEILLKNAYSKSLNSTVDTVIFDLKFVRWIEAFQLSMYCTWILELISLNKKIEIIFPESVSVLIFFKKIRFFNFLQEHSIIHNYPVNYNSVNFNKNEPFFPLTFLTEKVFNDFLDKLQNDEYYNLLFKEVRDAAVTKKGIIRDIILKELGDNMYNHGKGRFANFLMHKKDGKRIIYEKGLSQFEQTFFSSIKGKDYVEFIITDKGIGIPNMLAKTFKKEKLLEKNKKGGLDCAVIKYSTYEYSSSRSEKERLRELALKLSEDMKKVKVFTGLFQVLNIVKRFNGLLIIRSGKAIVSYNLYDYSSISNSITESYAVKNFKNLADFKGTQIKIVLPFLDDSLQPEIIEKRDIQFNTISTKTNYFYINLLDYFDFKDNKVLNLKNANSYERIVNLLRTKVESSLETDFLIDCMNHSKIDSKILFVLVCQVMVFQSRYQKASFTFVNLDSSRVESINEAISTQPDLPLTPIFIYTNNYQAKIIGLTDEEKIIFQKLISSQDFEDPQRLTFARTYSHLFKSDSNGLNVSFKHNKFEIIAFLKINIEDRIDKAIHNKKNDIYFENINVLTPSGDYTKAYYEIYSFITNPRWQLLLLTWIKQILFLEQPEIILSVGNYCYEFIESNHDVYQNKYLKSKHFKITPSTYESDISLLYNNLQSAKILIFTDVIASGKTLKRIIDTFENKQEIVVATIIDLTEGGMPDSESAYSHLKIISIISKKMEFYDSFPSDASYKDLMTVDTETFKLQKLNNYAFLENKSNIYSPVLNTYGINEEIVSGGDLTSYVNGFIKNLIIPNRAYYLKVQNKNGLMPVMFNIDLILRLIGTEIVEDLKETILRLEYKAKMPFSVIGILDYVNKPFRNLIKALINIYPQLEVNRIPFSHLDVSNINEANLSGKGVIIIDDAFTTGESLFKLIDYYERRKAKFIFCYLLIKRSSDLRVQRFRKLSKYGVSTIYFKYIFDTEFPVYELNNNPISYSLDEYQRLFFKFKEFPIGNLLNSLIKRNSYTEFNDTSIFNIETYKPEFVYLRWKLELSKTHFEFRKEISNIISNPESNLESIIIILELLENEKFVFLENSKLREKIFYENFKNKFISVLQNLLSERIFELDELSVYDALICFIYLDTEAFFSFFEKNLTEYLNLSKIYIPLLCTLSVYKKKSSVLNERMDILNTIRKRVISELNEIIDQTMLKAIESYWVSEYSDSNSFINKNRIFYIKGLLKTSFHDFHSLTRNILESTDYDIDEPFLKTTWLTIKEMTESALENFALLFANKFNPYIQKEIFPILENLINSMHVGDNFINRISKEAETIKKDILKYEVVKTIKQIDEIVFTNGLIFKLDQYYRIRIKGIIKEHKKLLETKFYVELLPFDENCVVFFLRSEFIRVIGNISKNLLIHSKSKYILIELAQETIDNENLLGIKIYEDHLDDFKLLIKDGEGIDICQQLVNKYSGNIKFNSSTSMIKEFNGRKYKNYVEIYLHDLSRETLIKA